MITKTEIYQRFIIQDPTDNTFFTFATEINHSHWTDYLAHAHLFASRTAAERNNQKFAFGNGRVVPVSVSFEYQV